MIRQAKLPGLVRLLYTHNPFYLISSGLILYGIYVAFRSEDAKVDDPWLLILSLCGYTALMAVTALLVIKLGKVWEDARSIVLILLFQFAALSMSFDEICAVSSATAFRLLLFGFAFSTLISEAVIGGLGIRFPRLFRLPYYLILGLFFFYPLCLSPGVTEATASVITWRIYLFSAFAGLAFLTLIPAVRRGAAYVAKSGTPWPWPWFPWTAFGFLAFAVCVRSYVLSQSFNVFGLHNAFGAYYLVPFFLALLFLLVEVSVVDRRGRLQTLLMVVAPALLAISIPTGDNFFYRRFLWMLQESLGSPMWMTLVGLALFYAYAWVRRLPAAEFGLVPVLALLSVVDRQAVDWQTLIGFQWWPLATLGGLQLALSITCRSSIRCAVSSACLVAASTIVLRDTSFVAFGGAIPFYMLLAAVLLIGLAFDDRFAAILRKAGVVLTVCALSTVITPLDAYGISELARLLYAIAATVVVWAYWWLVRDKWWFWAAIINVAETLFAGVWASYWTLGDRIGRKALIPLLFGAAFFVIAAMISAIKGGILKRLRTHPLAYLVLQRYESSRGINR